jgi:hypothetical protein
MDNNCLRTLSEKSFLYLLLPVSWVAQWHRRSQQTTIIWLTSAAIAHSRSTRYKPRTLSLSRGFLTIFPLL